MTASSTTANVRSAGHRTPAQLYCLLFGAALLLAGLFGFISSSSFSTGSGLEHKSFLGFDVNGWHNIVHLASGVVLLAAANLRPTAKTIAIGFGTVYGIVTIWGLIDGNDVLGIVAINGADNILHLVISALGIVAGMVSPTFNPEGRVGSRLEGRKHRHEENRANAQLGGGDAGADDAGAGDSDVTDREATNPASGAGSPSEGDVGTLVPDEDPATDERGPLGGAGTAANSPLGRTPEQT